MSNPTEAERVAALQAEAANAYAAAQQQRDANAAAVQCDRARLHAQAAAGARR